MGSCASLHRKSDSSGKHRTSIVHSESGKHPDFMPSTPVKEKPENVVVVDHPVNSHVYSSQVSTLSHVSSFSNYGSKEEAFFDSQPWLDSDCDEFYSVNGDFTPSRGSTPRHSSLAGTPLSVTLSPQANRALFDGKSPVYNEPKPSSSPRVDLNGVDPQNLGVLTRDSPSTEKNKKKKNLADLFRESVSENPLDGLNQQTEAEKKLEASPLKSGNATPYISGTSSGQRTPAAVSKPFEKGKYLKPGQCCFPRLKKTLVATPPPIAVDA